jgi:hypothetical protein
MALPPGCDKNMASMNADESLSEKEKSTQSRPELLDEEGLPLLPFDEVEEEIHRKKERWYTFKTP